MDIAETTPQPSGQFSAKRQPARKPRPRYNSHIGIDGDSRLLPLTDGRSVSARRFKNLATDIANDLGGTDHLSEAQQQLIRRASMLSAESERLEALWARGEAEFDINAYAVLTNALGRVLKLLGLRRVPRPVDGANTTALATYFNSPPEAVE